MSARGWVVGLERAWDVARLRRASSRPPAHFRVEPYIGHGGAEGVVVRGRVLDDPLPSAAVEGEGVGAAIRRTLRNFVTDELPGVPLRVTVADADVVVATDAEGYFLARLRPDPDSSQGRGPAAQSSLMASTGGCPAGTPRRSRCGCQSWTRGSGSSLTSTTRSSRPAFSGSVR